MSTPIFNMTKQLQYIKSKLKLMIYMIEKLEEEKKEDVSMNDLKTIEDELKKITKKTIIFTFRNEQK